MELKDRLALVFAESWRLLKVNTQLIYGIWRISKLPQPVVAIFGSARLTKTDVYFNKAHKLAQMFIERDISVLTGGGPGIMEAANCGAILKGHNGKARSMGISVSGLQETGGGGGGLNTCAQEKLILNYFFARKWLLSHYSSAFIIFPGGFGTLDEMCQIVTEIQTKKMAPRPVILVGKEYWSPFMDWLIDEALEHGVINKVDLALITVTDDLEEAFCLAEGACAMKPYLKD